LNQDDYVGKGVVGMSIPKKCPRCGGGVSKAKIGTNRKEDVPFLRVACLAPRCPWFRDYLIEDKKEKEPVK